MNKFFLSSHVNYDIIVKLDYKNDKINEHGIKYAYECAFFTL